MNAIYWEVITSYILVVIYNNESVFMTFMNSFMTSLIWPILKNALVNGKIKLTYTLTMF